MAMFLVTGATGGIGGAVAEALHERGHELLLAGRASARMDALTSRLSRARPVLMDLSRPDTIEAAVRADVALRARAPLAGLVHSAGMVELGRVADTPWPVWRDTLTVNLAAPAELTRVLLPALRGAGDHGDGHAGGHLGGHVVFVNSGSGQRSKADWSAYAASKFGLRALADALREEEAAHGVRVTTVYPGRTATGMQRRVRAQEGGDYEPGHYVPPAAVAAAVLAALDAPRGTEVTELSVRPTP